MRLLVLAVTVLTGMGGCQIVLELEAKELVAAGPTAADSSSGGSSDARSDADGGRCPADLSANAAHCGRCEHSCGGGVCSGGICGAVGVLVDQKSPFEIVTDDKYLFFTNQGAGGAVVRADKSGANPVTIAASLEEPRGLTVANGSVYWVTSSGAYSSTVDPPAIVGADIFPTSKAQRLAVVDRTLYWTHHVPAGVSACALTPIGGCGAQRSVASGQLEPSAIAADGTTVAWSYFGPKGDLNVNTGTVHVCALPCTTPRPVAEGRSAPLAMTIHMGQLYWVEEGPRRGGGADGLVRKCTLPGCTPIVDVAVNQLRPRAIAVDDDYVAWATEGSVADGGVYLCPRSSCSNPMIVADKLTGPAGVAMDAKFVYWTIPLAGLVMRRAKP